MQGHNDGSFQDTVQSIHRLDQHPVAGLEGGLHGPSFDFQQSTPSDKKQQQVDETSCCKWVWSDDRIQEAVTQASLRPFDCQNMPWISQPLPSALGFPLIDVHLAGTAELGCLPEGVVQVGECRQMIGLEVIGPEDQQPFLVF